MSFADTVKSLLTRFTNTILILLNIFEFLVVSLLYNIYNIDPVNQRELALNSFLELTRKKGVNVRTSESRRLYVGEMLNDHGHEFREPGPGDLRSPCPALNALANHGYIPRDGKKLTGTALTHSVIQCYNLSWPLASLVVWGAVLLLGKPHTFTLHDLAKHNLTEHDASLTHPNAREGEEYAPTSPSPRLFEALLSDATGDKFQATNFACARIRREKEDGDGTSRFQQEIARGEASLVLQVFGETDFTVPVELVRAWWGEERLPEGWRPIRKTTLLGTVHWATEIRRVMQRMRKEEVEADMARNGAARDDESVEDML